VNPEIRKWASEKGIITKTMAPYSPSQNGIAEYFNQTLLELMHTMLIEKWLPAFLWDEAVAHAVYLRNRAPTRALKGMTPMEAWSGTKSNVSHLREFGCDVWILDEDKNRLKLAPKSKKMVFTGFKDGPKQCDTMTQPHGKSRSREILPSIKMKNQGWRHQAMYLVCLLRGSWPKLQTKAMMMAQTRQIIKKNQIYSLPKLGDYVPEKRTSIIRSCTTLKPGNQLVDHSHQHSHPQYKKLRPQSMPTSRSSRRRHSWRISWRNSWR